MSSATLGKLRRRFGAISWRKVGLAFLLLGLAVILFLGGYLVGNWCFGEEEVGILHPAAFSDQRVYKNELYGLGLRYPKDWEAEEVTASLITFTPPAASTEGAGEGSTDQEPATPAREYISLTVSSNALRGKTACEEDQAQCSFYANGIYGARTSTPETESIFFSRGTNDFLFSLFRYECSDEEWTDYITIFEEMADSLRFTDDAGTACAKDEDCALGIHLDECCSCPEAFSASEIESNANIVAYESGKDYSSERTVNCSSVYCSVCPTEPSGVSCASNRCQAKE